MWAFNRESFGGDAAKGVENMLATWPASLYPELCGTARHIRGISRHCRERKGETFKIAPR
jgi:hypothetical protein